MARVKKPKPTLDFIFFNSPEQRVIRFLLSEPTSTFIPRVISSRLKGVRGLGGAEGITRILLEFQEMGLVDFVDNNRAVRLRDDHPVMQLMKTVLALCDLEGLKALLEPISKRGILFGSRATGKARSDSDYDLFVVTDIPEEVKKVTARHPIGKQVELVTWTSDDFHDIHQKDSELAQKISNGIVMWETSW